MLRYLPSLEPDETIYSFCAATHHLNGFKSHQATSQLLFGSRNGPQRHDIPIVARALPLAQVKNSESAMQIFSRHTIAAFYLPFLSEEAKKRSVLSYYAPDTAHSRIGRTEISRILAYEHPLKWCDGCVQWDLAQIGRAYWHLSHQFGTTMLCNVHQCHLRWVEGRHTSWLLPGEGRSGSLREARRDPCGIEKNLASLAKLIRSSRQINTVQLRAGVLSRLDIIGVSTRNKPADRVQLKKWLSNAIGERRFALPPARINRIKRADWVMPLLQTATDTDPLHWLTLWSALEWADVNTCVNEFRRSASEPTTTGGSQLAFQFSEPVLYE